MPVIDSLGAAKRRDALPDAPDRRRPASEVGAGRRAETDLANGRLCFFFGSGWGESPSAQHILALARELAGRGHRVVMLLHGEKRGPESAVHSDNPLLLSWPSTRPTGLKDARFLFGLIRKYRPDCLISSFGAGNMMAVVGKATGVPCLVDWYHTLTTQIDIDWRLPRWKLHALMLRKRLVYKALTHLIPVSHAARLDAESAYGIPSSKCHVFYNSLADPEGVLPPGLDVDPNKLVCVGRLSASKGQDVLIRAIAALRPTLPNLRVEFMGSGLARESNQQLAADLGIAEQCVFRGPASRLEILSQMRSAVATIVPSRSDNCPLVVIESLAVGTPVVASGVGGIVEMFRDRVEGRIVPPDDAGALAGALSEIVTNPELRATYSRNARQHFLDSFEISESVREQASWFEGTVARCRRV